MLGLIDGRWTHPLQYFSNFSTSSIQGQAGKRRKKWKITSQYQHTWTKIPLTLFYLLSDIQNLGLLCNVDLFPVPPPESADSSAQDEEMQRAQGSSTNQIAYGSTSTSTYPPDPQQHYPYSNANLYANAPTSLPMPPPPPRQPTYPPYTEHSEIITHVGNYPITESSKCTNALVGATFVQPANVDYKGKKALMFVFAVSGTIVSGFSKCADWLENVGSRRQDRGFIHPPLSRVRYFFQTIQ